EHAFRREPAGVRLEPGPAGPRRWQQAAHEGEVAEVPGGKIELISLTKRFAEIAVDDIDLVISSGEFFSLLGPSGCGKTTTLRLIAGFEQPSAGRILLDGADMAQVPPHKRKVNTV